MSAAPRSLPAELAALARTGLLAVLAGALALGCAALRPGGGSRDALAVELPVAAAASDPRPCTSLDVDDDDDDFAFVVVTDRTGEHREHVFRDAMPKVNLLRPAFVMSVGDLIEGYTEDERELAAQWDEFEGFTSTLRMPFF